MIFDDPFSGLDRTTEEYIVGKVFGPHGLLQRQKRTVVLCTHAVKHLPLSDRIIVLGKDGRVVEAGSYADLFTKGEYLSTLELVISGKTGRADCEETQSNKCLESKPKVSTRKPENEDKARQTGDFSTYRHYFTVLGLFSIIPFAILGISIGFLWNFSTVWLKFWSDFNKHYPRTNKRHGYYLGIYAMIQIMSQMILALFVWYTIIYMAVKAGSRFHQRALITVMAAPLTFFSTVDVGVTVNRFSQDLSVFDQELSNAMLNTAVTSMICIGQAAVIATATPYIAAGYPLLLAVLYFIQKVYLKTSRQLRFMDLEAKSPL